MTISTILLLPSPEHRERLLAPGAPMCDHFVILRFGWVCAPGRWLGADLDVRTVPPDARLVLARDGAEVYEGTDRSGRVLATGSPSTARYRAISVGTEIAVLLGHEPGLDTAEALERLRSIVAPLGTLVLLDERGEVVGG